MRKELARVGVLLALAFAGGAFACGSSEGGGRGGTGTTAGSGNGGSGAAGSSGNGGSSATVGAGGSTCDATGFKNDCTPYESCLASHCTTAYEDCFGPGFQSGDYAGSKCESFMSCVGQCACDTTFVPCQQACYQQATNLCTTCLTLSIGACASSSCKAEHDAC